MKQNRLQSVPTEATSEALSQEVLVAENRLYQGTCGISEENREFGFRPAFYDTLSDRCELSRYRDGTQAPVHLLEGLPADWIEQHDEGGKPVKIREGVVAGFLRSGRFYTREEASRAA